MSDGALANTTIKSRIFNAVRLMFENYQLKLVLFAESFRSKMKDKILVGVVL